jgi:molybdate transport system ATP-binding protein
LTNDQPAALGAVQYGDSLEGDALITRIAERLATQGFKLAGVVQVNAINGEGKRCGMALRELHSGETIAISADLGPAAGCKLDPAGLVHAAGRIEQALQTGDVDLVVLNKFGKQEGTGGGLRGALSEALLSGVPVLLGVSPLNLDACKQFAADCFVALPPDIDEVAAWCTRQCETTRRAREAASV